MTVVDAAMRTALEARRRTLIGIADHRWRRERAELAQSKAMQRTRFDELTAESAARYELIRDAWAPETAVPDWRAHVYALERYLLPRPPWEFLRNGRIMFTMFTMAGRRVLSEELKLVRARVGETALATALAEDPVGAPVLADGTLRTSLQALHHLFHLVRFEQSTGVSIGTLNGPTVEWGAGYGSLARVYRRYHGGAPTQVLIDLPIFSLLQWLFLSSIFGSDQVVLARGPGQPIIEGLINVVPVGWEDSVDCAPELFISTWALSESPAIAQDAVIEKDWFGARHLLLGHQRASAHFPDAERIARIAIDAGGRSEPVEVHAQSNYVFR